MKRDLMEQLITASLRFRKVDLCELYGDGIHISELIVMESVGRRDPYACRPLDMGEIQRRLHVSRPAVSQILNSLEKKGCIVRQIDPGDRRKIAVSATPKGHRLLEETGQNYDRAMQTVIARFGEENARTLVGLLDQLAEIIEEIKTENME